MINDLDDTIAELLRQTVPSTFTNPVNQVSISFAPPDNTFPPSSVVLPAIDLFLYDIRENRDLRSNERHIERGPDGMVSGGPPPTRVDCSYLITAWPSPTSHTAVQEEHQLIGEVMAALLRYPVLPRVLLKGALADQQLPPPAAALQAGSLQSMGEFWQALGGKPKVALHYTVTIAVESGLPAVEAPPVVDVRTRLRRM
jgi:Pvc16 N-terminal domain